MFQNKCFNFNRSNLFFKLFTVLILISNPLFSKAQNAEEEEPKVGTAPVWVYKQSSILQCEDSKKDLSSAKGELKVSENELKKAGVRVLTSERNVKSTIPAKIKCGEKSQFISCYLVLAADLPKAISAGFLEGGNCGKTYEKKTH